MEREYLSTRPKKLTYMPLPTGEADVWIRKNIEKITEQTEDGAEYHYECDLSYFRTTLSEAEITRRADEFFEKQPEDAKEPEIQETVPLEIEDRIQMIEDAIVELAELIGG